ncbi:hypothetical protein C8A00DRAFT_12689 [Chaetomidium leptoderma]|uniref:Uncharacterized protein n=1 Tax=Chaetomidium leptoderma TaxID=669021 RepID=A0AAN6VTW9_9PEZI|nr:hypothetical protein C8A00DRAFT_12689 [Chaetomidium leptoderma]
MLRLGPSVISLTRTDVAEVIHRRRFWRFLECDEDDVCISFTPTGTEAICNTTRSKPSSSRTVECDETPATYSGRRVGSPSRGYNLMHPLVADFPLLSSSEKGMEEDILSPAEVTGRQTRRWRAGDDAQQDPDWTLQLCLRPKHGLSAATTTNVDVDPESSADSQDSLENPKQRLPRDRQRMEESVAGPSTPRRMPSSGSSVNTLSPPALSRPVGPARQSRTQCQNSSEVSSTASACRAPGRIPVYNDYLPASSQPQTPQNLPESRHQSRLQGSYTAPARRTSPQPAWTPTTSRSRRGFGRTRELSPLGLQTPGFAGLYGGMENTDDAALAEEMAEEMARSRASTSRLSSSA